MYGRYYVKSEGLTVEFAIISLLAVAILILLFSFLRKDPVKDVEKQLENFSISLMQEILKLKKQVNVLEEELMLTDNTTNNVESKKG